jgi:Fic family protein
VSAILGIWHSCQGLSKDRSKALIRQRKQKRLQENWKIPMSYEPPFSITPEILNAVARISEQVGAIGCESWDNQPQLRRQNRIKTITGTLAIEGNTLSEDQITAIIDGKRVMGSAVELAEVQGAIRAYETVMSLNPFDLDDLLTAHEYMMGSVLTNAGRFIRLGSKQRYSLPDQKFSFPLRI